MKEDPFHMCAKGILQVHMLTSEFWLMFSQVIHELVTILMESDYELVGSGLSATENNGRSSIYNKREHTQHNEKTQSCLTCYPTAVFTSTPQQANRHWIASTLHLLAVFPIAESSCISPSSCSYTLMAKTHCLLLYYMHRCTCCIFVIAACIRTCMRW